MSDVSETISKPLDEVSNAFDIAFQPLDEGRCVKKRTFFFMHKAPTFTSRGFAIT